MCLFKHVSQMSPTVVSLINSTTIQTTRKRSAISNLSLLTDFKLQVTTRRPDIHVWM